MAVELRSRCLFCDRPRRANFGKKEKNAAREISKSDLFWICDDCQAAKPEHAKALELKLLAQGDLPKELLSVALSHQKFHSHEPVSELSGGGGAGTMNACTCQSCNERRKLEKDQMAEFQNLQSCWVQLRHAVRQMYRDRLLENGVTGRGRKYDFNKLKELVSRQCQHDPHQLYQRLENQAREHIMDIKVQLLQILVSPEKLGIVCNTEKGSSPINSIVARCFIHSLLTCATQLFETVKNMSSFLEQFQKDYLQKFGITWWTVNGYLFQTVVNLDPLLQSNLPQVYTQLGLTVNPNGHGFRVDNLPLDLADTLKKYSELNSCLTSSQTKMMNAHEKMDKCLAEEVQVFEETIRAKQKMLIEDLAFFKKQRKLLERYMSKKKQHKIKPGERADFSSFSNSLRGLLLDKRRATEHSASTNIDCSRCKQRHCACDECTISHLITCGLITEEDTIDLSDSIPNYDDMETSSNCSESDESDYGSVDSTNTEDKLESLDIICKQRTSIICSDGQKFTKVETILLPSNLYSLHNSPAEPLKNPMPNVFGSWEGASDAARLLLHCGHALDESLPADHSTKGHANTVADTTTVAATKSSSSNKANKETKENQLRATSPQDTKKTNAAEERTTTTQQHPPGTKPGDTTTAAAPQKPNVDASAIGDKGAGGGGCCGGKPAGANKDRKQNGSTDDSGVSVTTNHGRTVHNEVLCPHSNKSHESVVEGSEDTEDSSSVNSAESPRGKHCDCCYCEMFGYGNGEFPKHFGRDDYPQIRERLRTKLKRKDEQCPAQKSEQIEGYRGYESLDKILEYINGPQKTSTGPQSITAVKAKKKQRQTKQKKALNSNGGGGGGGGSATGAPIKQKLSPPGQATAPLADDSMPDEARENKDDGLSSSVPFFSRLNVDEVFKPKNIDLNSNNVDEAEREVELFKRFVLDCQPRENREKVNLNINVLLGSKQSQMKYVDTVAV